MLAGATEVRAALERVTLQLKWRHQFQFAGYYAAQAQGYYREAGLEVEIKEAMPEWDTVDRVLRGEADFGVGTSDLLLRRYQGAPVVVLAVIFQHSPLALVARHDADIANLHDLVGKRVMIEPDSAELFAYLKREGIENQRLRLLPHGFDISDLIAGRVDGMSIYLTDELFALAQAKLPYVLFQPTSASIDFYGDNLFTTEAYLNRYPHRVAAFRAASLKGWQYAMAHREEIARLIFAQYSARHSLAHLLFEAEQMDRLMHPGLIEPGYMHEGRWRHIAATYIDQGMLPTPRFDDALWQDPLRGFLYVPEPWLNLVQLRGYALAGLGVLVGVGGVAFYILRLNRRLARSEQRYRVLYETAPTAFVLWDRECRVTGWNRAAEGIFGWRAEEVIGRTLFEFLVPEDQHEQVRNVVGHALADQGGGSVNWNMTKFHGRILCEWRNAPLYDHRGRIIGAVGLATDVTERQRMEDRLQFRAHYDALTELPNRLLFSDRLEQAVALARRSQGGFALFFIDLDGFKTINDRYGHAVGDRVLQEVARRLGDCVRDSDTLARLGGDEFVALLHGIHRYDDAELMARKLIAAVARPFATEDGTEPTLGASIGIALYPEDSQDAQSLLNTADNAMYEAKRWGKNTYWWAGRVMAQDKGKRVARE